MFAPRLRLITLLCATLIAGCGTPMVNPVTGETERTVMDESAEIAEGKAVVGPGAPATVNSPADLVSTVYFTP